MDRSTSMLPRHHNPLICSIFRVHHLFHILLVLAGQATCRPTRVPSNNDRKDLHQDPHGLRETEVVYMVGNVSVLQNVVPECCTLTFIPVSFPNGDPAVKIVTSCTLMNTAEDPGGSCGMNGTPANQSTAAASGTSTPGPMSTNMTQITVLSTGTSTISSSASISLSLTTLSTPTTPLSSFTSSAPSTTPTLSPPLSSSNTFSSQPNAVTPTTAASNASTSTSSAVVTSTSPAKVAAAISSRTASTLPKVIGGLAGVAVGLLIIAGTIGYVKQKRMKKDEAREIQWPS
ncbi:hypothetical protein JB92DRAFT_3044556 [Gautieria morchelliformis]|nr:hypothetical protein JB92DRAFT_3044556 [Gautieria morchelliformis]